MKKILLVDDEKGIVDMLKSYFEMQSYQVYTAYDGKTALSQAAHNPDLVLLDINMPDMDGLTVCEKIRNHISCPILFLTARIEIADKIKGFQVGADDYVIKPFDLDELGARVAAHIRRENRRQAQSTLRFFSDMVIDYSKREVSVCGEKIALSKKEFFTILFSINASVEDANFRQIGTYSHGEFKALSQAQYNEIKDDPRIKEYGLRIIVGTTADSPFNKGPVEVSSCDVNQAQWMYLDPIEGTLPTEGTNEAATDMRVLELLGIEPKIGTEFSIPFSVDGEDTTETFTLCGWWEYNEAATVSHTSSA